MRLLGSLLGSLLASYTRAKIVGRLIAWHEWRARRCARAQRRHAAALLTLARVSQRELDRVEGLLSTSETEKPPPEVECRGQHEPRDCKTCAQIDRALW